MRGERKHWEGVYERKGIDEVSWHEEVPRTSLELIEQTGISRDAPIVDVGGGAARLAVELVGRGYEDVTVADISAASLERARESAPEPERIEWVQADARDHDFGRRFALWHDRAVFHFMVDPEDQRGYLATLERSLAPGGHAIIATFGPEGPSECSGLPVARYDADALAATIADRATLVGSHLEEHRTPGGNVQQFLFARFAAD